MQRFFSIFQYADRHLRGFPCWGQFVAMLFCQLRQAYSLRGICGGLTATEGKLKHPGLSATPKRSTLSYANRQRPWQTVRNRLPSAAGHVPRSSSTNRLQEVAVRGYHKEI